MKTKFQYGLFCTAELQSGQREEVTASVRAFLPEDRMRAILAQEVPDELADRLLARLRKAVERDYRRL